MDNINTLDELFEKWIEKQNEENPETYLPKEIPAYSFDKDGYICKDEYEKSKTRILFIGKEKYKFWKTGQKVKAKHVSDLIGETLDHDRALTEDEAIKFNIKWNEVDKGFGLKNVTENENYKETMYSKRVAMLTNAIMSEKFDEPDKSHEVLRKIATINLNKRGGFNRCRWDVLEEYTRRYAKFINREIELLKPDIIVCLSKDVKWFFDEGILEAPSEAKVIAVFHPSYLVSDMEHLEKLRDELKGAEITWVTQNKK